MMGNTQSVTDAAGDQELITEEAAAVVLGVKPGTLQVWRCTKRYPLTYVKVGRLVRYRRADLQAFLQARTMGGAE